MSNSGPVIQYPYERLELASNLSQALISGLGSIGFAVTGEAHDAAIEAVVFAASSASRKNPEVLGDASAETTLESISETSARVNGKERRFMGVSIIDLGRINYKEEREKPDLRELVLYLHNNGRHLSRIALATVIAVPQEYFPMYQKLSWYANLAKYVTYFTESDETS